MSLGLILSLLFRLPTIIGIVIKVVGLIRDFEGKGFWDIANLAREILDAILGLAPTDKALAKQTVRELHSELARAKRLRDGNFVSDERKLMEPLVHLRDRVKPTSAIPGNAPDLVTE